MVFSSLEFIFVFLPVFLAVYYICPDKFKNLCIFVGSLIFYACGVKNWQYVVLLLASVAANYLCGRLIDKFQNHKKLILIAGIIYNFLWLLLFKYTAFGARSLNTLLSPIFKKGIVAVPQLILPVGISFYTFNAVSYIIDIYRGKYQVEKSFINFGTFLCMFPHLTAGPITTYGGVRRNLKRKAITLNHFNNGLKIFTVGLGYKVLLANLIGNLWNKVCTIGFANVSTPLAWLGIAAYSMQLYFDFFGYSLMAMGLGEILGFQIPNNFAEPYLSTSMTEFWRRWHITLGRWFKEYLYFPLGGSREGKNKTIRNLFIVWLATGLWHGAAFNFLIWGLCLFVLILIEKLWLKKYLDKYRILGHIYLIFVCLITWAVFAITDLSQLGVFFGRLFPFFSSPSGVMAGDFVTYLSQYGLIMLAGVICCTGFTHRMFFKLRNKLIGTPILLAIFLLSVRLLYKGMDNPFLYFSF